MGATLTPREGVRSSKRFLPPDAGSEFVLLRSRVRSPKLPWVILACLAAAVGTLTWMVHTTRSVRVEVREQFFEQYNRQQLLIAQQAARNIEALFATFRRNLSLTGSLFADGEVTRQRAFEVGGTLRAIFSALADTPVIDLVVFDRDGTVVAIEPPDPYTLGRSYAWRGYYQWARNEGRPGELYLSPFLQLEGGQNRGDMALIVAQGIYGEGGGFQGVAMATVNFDGLAREQVLSVRVGENGYAWLIDNNNRTILVDPRGRVGGQNFATAFLPQWPKLYELVESTNRGEPGVDWYDFEDPADPSRGVRKLVGYAPVRIEDRLWTLGVCTPTREVEALMASFLLQQERFSAGVILIMLAGTALLCGGLLAWNRLLTERVTERTRDLEDARSRLTSAFDELVTAKKLGAAGRLALGLVHEIRNPLSSIRMNLQMIRKKVSGDGPLQEHFAIAEEEIQRLNGLLDEVLDFARPRTLRLQRVAVPRLTAPVLTLLEERLRAGQVRMETEIDPSLPAVVCDAEQIRQVLLNLILNAVDAMSENGRENLLRLSAHCRSGFLDLSVEDTGPGIEEDQLEAVFDPFYTTKSRGGGLGLSVSQSIVVRHGGTLGVRSRVGVGTTFSVQLPVGGPEGGRACDVSS